MSDIVERLRLRRDPLTDGERAEAADEIERLRGAYEQERKDCINLTEKVIPNLRDEIERLRAMIKDRDALLDAICGSAADIQTTATRIGGSYAAHLHQRRREGGAGR
jgi:DNA repair exonuclease SbcCD ATPase subunit